MDKLVNIVALLAQGVGVGAVIAFLFERVEWFQGLNSKAKYWVIFSLSVGLPLLAQILIQNLPGAFWDAIEPYWQALATGLIFWAGSQGVHLLVKRANGA